MKTLSKNKNILIAILVSIVIIIFYSYFFKSEVTSLTPDVGTTSIGDETLVIFKRLQAVTLSQDLFSLPGYLLLVDFTTEIQSQSVGRPNPFDIIGRN